MSRVTKLLISVTSVVVLLGVVTIIHSFATGNVFGAFTKEIKVVNGTDMPIPLVVQDDARKGSAAVG